jgi:hypothetical protein
LAHVLWDSQVQEGCSDVRSSVPRFSSFVAGHIYALCSYTVTIYPSLEWRYLEYHEHNPDLDRDETLGQFIQSHGYSLSFQEAYLVLLLIYLLMPFF